MKRHRAWRDHSPRRALRRVRVPLLQGDPELCQRGRLEDADGVSVGNQSRKVSVRHQNEKQGAMIATHLPKQNGHVYASGGARKMLKSTHAAMNKNDLEILQLTKLNAQDL